MKHLNYFLFTVTVLTAIFVVVALMFCIFAAGDRQEKTGKVEMI